MSAKVRFAFQGAPGAFSHQAAIALAKQLAVQPDFQPCSTFCEVFDRIAEHATEYSGPISQKLNRGLLENPPGSIDFSLIWN